MTIKSIAEVICENLNISIQDLFLLSMIAPSSYKVYTIPKRSGGRRTIAQPTAELKKIQRCIVTHVLDGLPISTVSTAYQKELSIKNNAEKHLGKKFILKMDFKDFFPSIQPYDLIQTLEKNYISLSNNDRKFLTLLLFRRNKHNGFELSIGAPSSPIISNVVMYDFDLIVKAFCDEKNISFTRYADDLTFSSNNYDIIKLVPSFIEKCTKDIVNPRLKINNDKTHIISKGRSQRVTGIVLTHNNNISIGRSLRKKIRVMLHTYYHNSLDKRKLPYLHGVVSHARNIEPEFFMKLINIYGDNFFITLAKNAFAISKAQKNT